MLDIVLGRERVAFQASQLAHLVAGVAEVLTRRTPTISSSTSFFPSEPRLDRSDEMIVREIFWDLVVDKIITPGLDPSNAQFPWFRLHSEAESNRKKVEEKRHKRR